MRVKEEFNQITVQENPGCLWFVGIFFASIGGVLIYGALGGFTNFDEIPRWQLLMTFLMGAGAVGTGIWAIYNAPITKVVVNRRDDTITHQRIGLFGRRTQTYNFDQIKQFSLIEEFDSERELIWSLGMELTNGELIKISSLPSHSEKFKRDFVFQINEFLHKPLPSYKAAELPEDESETKMS